MLETCEQSQLLPCCQSLRPPPLPKVCVQTTMREANDRGYECLLVSDATESYFPELKASTMAMITSQAGFWGLG
jgi:Isochorismatase family